MLHSTSRMGQRIKQGVLGAFLLLGHAARIKGVPVLLYHSLDDDRSIVSFPPGLFAHQMAFLAEQGYRVVGLGAALREMGRTGQVPPRTVVLTFDDGLRNTYTEGFRTLRRHGFSATVFVTTDRVGGTAVWNRAEGIPDAPMLGWAEIREMHGYGIEIESHSATHPRLTALGDEALRKEVASSKARIEDELGKGVELFCYPYGDHDERVVRAVRAAGYRAATTVELGKLVPGTDPMTVPRIGMDFSSALHPTTALLILRTSILGTFPWFVRSKRFLLAHAGPYLSRFADATSSEGVERRRVTRKG